jgi:ethanolamine utilization cobalamin adenosyltransferase
MQVIRNQVFRDEKLITLVATMESIFSFVDVIQSDITDKVKVLEDIIKRIFIQTVECGIFIREYANHGFVGKCV